MEHPRADRPNTRERGDAIVVTLIVMSFLLVLSLSLVTTTTGNYQQAGAYRDMAEARYAAEAGLQHIAAMQNDHRYTTRYLFNPASYVAAGGGYYTGGADPSFAPYHMADPESGDILATVSRQIVGGSDPLANPPPYTVQSSATVRNSTRTLEAEIAPLSLLEYALWTEQSVSIAPYITYSGKVYSATYINLTGSPVTFMRKAEYVTSFYNSGFAQGPGGGPADIVHLPGPKPSLTSLVDLTFYEDAAKLPAQCDSGIGIYLGNDGGNKNNAAFARPGGGYQIDLTLFDFSGPHKTLPTLPTPVTYNGIVLKEHSTGLPLMNFNGVIFVDATLHVWGINGGRSVEDFAARDDTYNTETLYVGPLAGSPGTNWYSDNRLGPGEDGTNGGTVNGVLDTRNLGQGLTIVTRGSSDIWIDHNVLMGANWDGTPVRTALIAGRAIHVEKHAPKTITIQAALMALGSSNCPGEGSSRSWLPCGDHDDHNSNWWARQSNGTYQFDLDRDASNPLETNNGAYQSYDRDETSVLDAWSLQVLGNRIFSGRPSSGHWASGDNHRRYYTYDPTLLIYEPPCYPVLPEYDLVAGTVREIR